MTLSRKLRDFPQIKLMYVAYYLDILHKLSIFLTRHATGNETYAKLTCYLLDFFIYLRYSYSVCSILGKYIADIAKGESVSLPGMKKKDEF